ncbi:MAG: carboxypeptidase-like regulatory domain-containing protein, partial [Sporichthyaceae bacterium]|nr:carboxypeptidase-like regulatory domain-containing protein [Sporichthyaceae bacterium]
YFEVSGADLRQGIALDVRDERFARQRTVLDGLTNEAILTLRLGPPQLLEGQVLAADTGRPLPYARLSMVPVEPRDELLCLHHHVDARADAQGRFRVQPLPGGAFRIYACAPEEEPYLTLVQRIDWPAGTRRQELTLRLPPGISLRGQVVEADTGRPVAGAFVQYMTHSMGEVPPAENQPQLAGESRAWSGADGRFWLPAGAGRGQLVVHVPRGDYLVRPPDPLASPTAEHYASVYAHDLLPLDLPPNCREHEVRATVQPVGRLHGRVLDAAGQPVSAGMLITAGVFSPKRWTGARRFALREGAFALPSTDPAQTYPVVVLDMAHEHGAFAAVPARPTNGPALLRLQECGRAEGRLLDQDHRPLPGSPIELDAVLPFPSPGRPNDRAEVSWYTALGQRHSLRTDEAGRFTLPALVPGVPYRLYAGTGDSRRLAREFTVTAGQMLQLD